MKQKEYFSHDYYARSELRNLRQAHGMGGVGVFWSLVEILHEQGGQLSEEEAAGIIYDLHIDEKLYRGVVYDSGLFIVENGVIYSNRVLRNLEEREKRSKSNQNAANVRWKAQREAQAAPYKTLFSRRFADYEASGNADVWNCRGCFDTVVDLIIEQGLPQIDGADISISDYLHTIQGFLQDDSTLRQLAGIISDINEKAERGELCHKEHYLISALYKSAKLNGW